MNRATKLATALVGLAVGAAALAACTASPAPDTAGTPTATAVATVTPRPTPKPGLWTQTPTPIDCANRPTGKIHIVHDEDGNTIPDKDELRGEITDSGPREMATGEATLNDDGQIVAYTIQPGDVLLAIGERFCIDEYSVATHNDVSEWYLQPGEVLVLRPSA
jgi:LysM repeat protein